MHEISHIFIEYVKSYLIVMKPNLNMEKTRKTNFVSIAIEIDFIHSLEN